MNKDDEVKFYNEHRAEMERPEAVRLSEILIAPKPPAKPVGADGKPEPPTEAEQAAALSAAQSKAQEVLEQIHQGGNFADLAKKNSDGPSAKDGGDLSYFNRGTLAKELEDKVFALKAGETTDVVRTKQGYVILQVTEHQLAGIPTMKEIRAAHPGRVIYAEIAARIARLFDDLAGTGIHRHQARICRLGRECQTD